MERADDEAAGRYRARLDAAREKAAGATEDRDQAVKERDEAKGERDDALRDRDGKRDQALVKRADALGKLITAHEAGRVVGLGLQAVTNQSGTSVKKKLETAREDRDADWEPFLDDQVDKAKSAGYASEGRQASAAELKTQDARSDDQAHETAAVNEEVMEEMLGQRDTAVNELGVGQAQVDDVDGRARPGPRGARPGSARSVTCSAGTSTRSRSTW